MSETVPETPAQDAPEESAETLTAPAEDAPESEWKQYARKWERLAKAKQQPVDLKADPKYREALAKAKRLDELEQANATELEKAQKAADENATRAQQATARAVSAEVKALADGFRVRNDALVFLRDRGDLARFVGDDGEIDEKAISKELAEILKERSDLAADAAKPDPAKPGQRPTETLRPGAAPAEPERAGNLFDAVGAWATQT